MLLLLRRLLLCRPCLISELTGRVARIGPCFEHGEDFRIRCELDIFPSLSRSGGGGGGGGGGGEKRKRLEVVHVVLWSNVTDVLDFDESFRAHITDLPWLAVPNRDYERKVSFLFLRSA